jgi:hypothetical protein
MSKKTVISNILVIPHSPTVWIYYINDGDRHAVSEKVVVNLLSEIAPSHVYSVYEKMSRKLGFFIDLEKNEFFEASYDEEELLKELQKARNSENFSRMRFFTKEKPKIIGQQEKEEILSKFTKRLF